MFGLGGALRLSKRQELSSCVTIQAPLSRHSRGVPHALQRHASWQETQVASRQAGIQGDAPSRDTSACADRPQRPLLIEKVLTQRARPARLAGLFYSRSAPDATVVHQQVQQQGDAQPDPVLIAQAAGRGDEDIHQRGPGKDENG